MAARCAATNGSSDPAGAGVGSRHHDLSMIEGPGAPESCADAPPAPYTMAGLAGDLAGLMDHLGIRRAAVVGYSLGSFTAELRARTRPDLVGALVLMAGAGPLTGVVDAVIDAEAELVGLLGHLPPAFAALQTLQTLPSTLPPLVLRDDAGEVAAWRELLGGQEAVWASRPEKQGRPRLPTSGSAMRTAWLSSRGSEPARWRWRSSTTCTSALDGRRSRPAAAARGTGGRRGRGAGRRADSRGGDRRGPPAVPGEGLMSSEAPAVASRREQFPDCSTVPPPVTCSLYVRRLVRETLRVEGMILVSG
ncbi:alpha/beta hydrolase [Streptomyces sp. NBC_01244]|nr:alpha/beta hydrolase [Streptomyces sp. NBC_01244]